MKKAAIFLAAVIVVLLGILIFVKPAKSPSDGSSTVSVEAVSADGHLHVTMPLANNMIVSPLAAKGTVIGGGWFFEASFPVKVLDADGTVLGQGPAQAQGDWMSAGSVPFTTNIIFKKPKHATGTVVFARDNPSGDPQNAQELHIPVRFQ